MHDPNKKCKNKHFFRAGIYDCMQFVWIQIKIGRAFEYHKKLLLEPSFK